MQSAKLSRRTGAFFIDMLLIWALHFFAVNTFDTDVLRGTFITFGNVSLGIDLLGPILLFSYFLVCELFLKRSPGKILLNLRIVTDDDGPYNFLTLLVRNFGKIFSYFLLLGFIIAFFNRNNLTLHDMIANTKVVSEEPEPETSGG